MQTTAAPQSTSRAALRAELARSLRAARRVMVREAFAGALSALGAGDLTLSQLASLMLLDGAGEAAVGEIASRLGRSVSATSRLLDQLVRRELVRRREDPSDRRVRKVALTRAGRKLIDGLSEQRAEAQLRLVEGLSPEEQAQVARGMALLSEAARRRDDGTR